jgi:NAD(P)-dependent dehydrogenase (short-subunit alcohol dehydrogenase family)
MSQASASEPTAVIPDLRDKVVLITGASTGIGAAAARAFGRNGAKVAINYRQSQAEAEQVAEAARQLGGEALLVQKDVVLPDAASEIVRRTVEAFGRLDVLINNAGALIRRTPVADYTDAYLDALLDLNVKQVVRFVHEGALQMRAQGGGGCIINLSSIAARNGGAPRIGSVCCREGLCGDCNARLGQGAHPRPDPGQCGLAWRDHDALPRSLFHPGAACVHASHDPDGAGRLGRGVRRCFSVSRFGADERLRYGADGRGKRRPVHALTRLRMGADQADAGR